jgi:hypothetical protein
MNKSNFKILFPISAVLLTAIFSRCEKDASSQAFGNDNTQIFMPQATISALRYTVPSGLDSATRNYYIDAQNNKVNIILGVAASGAQALSTYTVNVVANTDTINQMISSGVLPAATTAVLPSSIYTLPATVTVASGVSAAPFYLSIDKTQLKTYAGKTLALEVVINNPSKYAINASINKTIVLINVSALNL